MNNPAATGYALISGKKLGLDEKELQELESIMYGLMDLISEEEDEEVYRKN